MDWAKTDANEVFSCFKELIALRKTFRAFMEGGVKFDMKTRKQLFRYERSFNGDCYIVECNLGKRELRTRAAGRFARKQELDEVSLRKNKTMRSWKVLFTTYGDTRLDLYAGNSGTPMLDYLRPYEGRILCR